MGFLDILHAYWPYIAGIIVLVIAAVVVYNKFKAPVQKSDSETPLIEQQQPPPPDTSQAKEGDKCSYCKEGRLHIVENEQEIRLECAQCTKVHKLWPLQTV